MTLKKIKAMHDRMTRLKEPFVPVWDSINKVYRSFHVGTRGTSSKVMPITINEDIFDSTGSESMRVQTEGITGYLTNPASDWFSLRFEDDDLNENHEGKLWLDSVAKMFRRVFPKTNFYNANSMMLDQGQLVGTGFMFPERDGARGFNFQTFNEHDVWIDENSKDNVDRVVIKKILTTEVLIEEYGENVPKIVKDAEEKAPYREWVVYIAIYPNKDHNEDLLDSFAYSSTHWLDEARDEEAVLREGGYRTFPMICWRMFKIPSLAWGYGTCLEALPEVEKLNLVERDLLTASNFAVDPMWAIPQDMEDEEFDRTPGGMVPVADMNKAPRPMNPGLNYPIGKDVKQDYRRRVENIFKVDFYRLLQTLSERAMTATQVNEMANEKAATIGVMVSRIITEYLNPLFDRLFEIAFENGMLPPVPASLVAGGADFDKIKVDYEGVLAQMLKRFTAVVSANQIVQSIGVLGQISPEVYDNVDVDVLARDIVEASARSASSIRPKDVVEQIRQQRAQVQQMQMQMQMQQSNADAYAKTKAAPEDGSAAQEMMNNA